MKTIQDTLFVNSTREMVSLSFELDKEGSGIIFFFFLLRSWQIEILLALFLYRAKKLTISLILFTKKTLSTSLILAICRTGLIYELRAKLQNTPQLWSASLTCVGRLWRSRHNTIHAILIQWHINELRGILKLLRTS